MKPRIQSLLGQGTLSGDTASYRADGLCKGLRWMLRVKLWRVESNSCSQVHCPVDHCSLLAISSEERAAPGASGAG